MNRTPMNRGSGFKRVPLTSPVRLRDREPLPESMTRLQLCRGVFAQVADVAPAIPKEDAIEHEPYRRLVALMDCIHCGKQNRSQHAHENEGKGKAMKLDDRRAMPLCADEPGREGCHQKFDNYRLVPGGRPAHIELGRIWAAQTREAIRLAGLWPAGLPEL